MHITAYVNFKLSWIDNEHKKDRISVAQQWRFKSGSLEKGVKETEQVLKSGFNWEKNPTKKLKRHQNKNEISYNSHVNALRVHIEDSFNTKPNKKVNRVNP